MSLQKEIEYLLMWQDNIQGQDATYQQKASIAINKILDAAVESLKNEADQMSPGFEYDRGVHDAHKIEAPRIINKLRPKS